MPAGLHAPSSSSTPARCWHSSRRLLFAAPVCMLSSRRVDAAAIAIETLGPSSDNSFDNPEARLGAGSFNEQAAAGDAAAAPRGGAVGTRSQRRRRQHSSDPKPAAAADKALEALANQYLGTRSQVWAVQREQPLPYTADEDPRDPTVQVAILARQNKFQEACAVLRTLVEQGGPKVYKVSHKAYLHSARHFKSAAWAYKFLELLPKDKQGNLAPAFNMGLMVCAECRDITTANSILKLAEDSGTKPDTKLLTSYITVCKSVGDVERAFATYVDLKRRGLPVDTHVVGALVSTISEGMQATPPDASSSSGPQGRKEKFVLMERALGVVKEAQDAGCKLSSEVWNSLMVCAGRCGQLKRALELLDAMHLQGLRTDAYTYGALMEACIEAQRPELALRLFEQARHEGHTGSVELYTLATTACRSPQRVDWEHAVQLYNLMQRAGVAPDSKYYAALITVAGLAGHVDYALELLADLHAESVRPDTAVCSALITACVMQQHQPVARRVYDLCAAQGVFPGVAQYNRLMDWYASERRFGDVVFLLNDMTSRAKLTPNINTYRVLINACQRADQAALAFEVFAVMKANRVPLLQERFAHVMYFSLIKACHNMQRHILAAHNPHPAPWASGSHRWGRPEVRMAEARQVLLALGTSLQARGSSCLLLQDPDATQWAQYALSCYRDMLARGWRPNFSILDKLLGCLRLPGSMALQHAVRTGITNTHSTPSTGSSPGAPSPAGGVTAAGRAEASRAEGEGLESLTGPTNQQLLQAFKYQVAFERRAVNLVEDAITRGLLPSFTVDQACTLDLTAMPPTLAEVYVLAVMVALERRAARARSTAGAEGGAAGDAQLFFHRVTLLVPPFQPQLVLWPSYVPKLGQKQDLMDLSQPNAQADTAAATSQQLQAAAPVQGRHAHDTEHSQQQQQQQQQQLGAAGPSSSQVAAPGQRQPGNVVMGTSGMYTGPIALGDEEEGEETGDDASEYGSLTLLPDDPTAASSGSSSNSLEGEEVAEASSTTGLAVAATLRRLKFFARMQPNQGVVTLEPSEISKWIRAKRTFEMRLSGALSPAGAPQGAASLAQRFSQAADGQPAQQASAASAAYQAGPSPYQPPQQHAPPTQPQLQGHAEQPRMDAPAHSAPGMRPGPGMGGPMGPPGACGGHMVPGLNGPGGLHNPAEQQRLIRLGLTGAAMTGGPSAPAGAGMGPVPGGAEQGPGARGPTRQGGPQVGSSSPPRASPPAPVQPAKDASSSTTTSSNPGSQQ